MAPRGAHHSCCIWLIGERILYHALKARAMLLRLAWPGLASVLLLPAAGANSQSEACATLYVSRSIGFNAKTSVMYKFSYNS